jgi:hypothetical protein
VILPKFNLPQKSKSPKPRTVFNSKKSNIVETQLAAKIKKPEAENRIQFQKE